MEITYFPNTDELTRRYKGVSCIEADEYVADELTRFKKKQGAKDVGFHLSKASFLDYTITTPRLIGTGKSKKVRNFSRNSAYIAATFARSWSETPVKILNELPENVESLSQIESLQPCLDFTGSVSFYEYFGHYSTSAGALVKVEGYLDAFPKYGVLTTTYETKKYSAHSLSVLVRIIEIPNLASLDRKNRPFWGQKSIF